MGETEEPFIQLRPLISKPAFRNELVWSFKDIPVAVHKVAAHTDDGLVIVVIVSMPFVGRES